MTGPLAQLIALTAYGNDYLMTGNLLDFYPSNTTFQFCNSVDFVASKKPLFFSNFSKPKEAIVAATPTD